MQSPKEFKDTIIELQRKREFREAFEVTKTAMTIYPTNPFFLSSEIFLLYKMNRTKEARAKAEERFEHLKNDIFFLKVYVAILEKLKAKRDIENFIDNHILTKKVGNEDFYIFITHTIERILGKDKAVEIINRALILFPDSAKLKEIAEKLHKSHSLDSTYKFYKDKFKGMEISDAICEIERIRVLPDYINDFDLLALLAELYKKQGDFTKAIEIYKHILTFKDNEFTRKMLGYAYYKSGNYKSALIYLRDFFLKNPEDYFLYSTIYNIFKEMKDSEGLNKLITEALSLNPSARHLYGLLSRAKKWKKD